MDIHRLILEVQRRPALWDTSHPDHSNRVETKRLWESVAFVLGLRTDVCRSKWKNLRCSYRRLQKQHQSPISASPAPQWPYMRAMSFLEFNHDDSLNITPKAEPTEGEMELEADNDNDNDLLMQEFQSMATPQALRRLSHNISLASAVAEEEQAAAAAATSAATATATCVGAATPVLHRTPAVAAAAASSCQCAKRVDEQVNFLQSLEREEQQLMQSTSQDLARCKNVLHVGDSDYNFLISFLPLMKQMSPLQNVHFRAKMGELLLQTIQQPPVQAQPQQQQHMPQPMSQPMAQPMPQPMQQPMQQQQAEEQQQKEQQKEPKQEPLASQMLLNQQQMALDQAQQVSTSSTSWN